jgi:hypothetical protein
MSAMVGRWLRGTYEAYVGNPTAVRDYRAQLRGSKAMWLWAVYLFIFISISMIGYATATQSGTGSLASIQSSMTVYYTTIAIILAIVVSLISPALTATSIVSERLRRSLDLVFTTPMEYRSYLVGKLLSSYRYTWMLLILSLPVTATCVLLGGATWVDVAYLYLLLSAHGLIFSAIGLVCSAMAPKPISAIAWSYFIIAFYMIITVSIGFASAGPMIGRTIFNGTPQPAEAPFGIALNPFMAVFAAPTYTVLFGVNVSNAFIVLLVAALISKLLLLGAASSMSPYDAVDTKSLRVHGLIYMGLTAYLLAPSFSAIPGTRAGLDIWKVYGMIGAWMLILFVWFIPHVTCHSRDADRRFRQDGVFRFRNVLRGTASGALPYIILLWAVVFGTLLIRGWWIDGRGSGLASDVFLECAVWTLGFLVLYWSAGRLVSSYRLQLSAARALHFVIVLATIVLPWPVIVASDAAMYFSSGAHSPFWSFYVLTPMTHGDVDANVAVIGIGMAIVGGLVAWLAEMNYSRISERVEVYR